MLLRIASLVLPLILAGVTGATALPAPRLDFTAQELAMARSLARDPDLAAFYGARELRPVFSGPEGAARRAALAEAIASAPAHGLPLARYAPGLAATGTEAGDELLLARTFALWVRDVSGGIVVPGRVSAAIKRPNAGAPVAKVLAAFADGADPAAVLADVPPADPRYRELQRRLAAAQGQIAPPGTPEVPRGTWREGAHGPAIAALRARLAALGHPAPAGADPESFDTGLAAAVLAFQQAAGLPPDGVAGPRTVERLNAKAAPGTRALLMAMERFRWLPDDLGARHVWVNLPEFRARVVEGTHTVFDTKVVIGKTAPEMQTPEFSDIMEYVVANPRWVVPRSITVKEYLPRLKSNPNAAAHLDIFDRRGRRVDRSQVDFSKYSEANFPYRMQQKPSEDNALGIVKFIFPNPWNIYLHDTPSKGLFNEKVRAFSHGCIRVGRPVDLAHELLRPQSKNPAAAFSAALKGGEERYLHLDTPLPVHLVYFTTWVGEDGALQHFGDIYGRDAALWAAWQAAVAAPSPLEGGLETVLATR